MKNIKYIMFLFLITLSGIINVNAEEKNLLDGIEKASPGDEIIYELKVDVDSVITKYDVTLTYESDVLELVSLENEGSWKGTNTLSKSPTELQFKHETGVVGESTIAKLKFKINDTSSKAETTITLDGRVTTAEDETINNLEKYSKSISIKSTDNTLKTLKYNGTSVTNFKKDTFSYAEAVESSVMYANIEAELSSETATFKEGFGPRQVTLDYGENKIEVTTVAASGDEKTYIITITKQDNRGTDNSLSKIILNGGKIDIGFSSNTLLYNIKTYKLDEITVSAIATDSKAKVNVEKEEKLHTGENTIKIIVTSEQGTEKIYTIIVDNVNYSVDTSLRDINIYALGGEIDINFSRDVYDYDILYKSRYKDSIVVNPVLSSQNGEAKIDQELLNKYEGKIKSGTKVEIRVYGDDGGESTYTLNFVKDERINFFFIFFLVLLIVLSIILFKLYQKNKKGKIEKIKGEKEKNLEKTRKIVKIGA